MTTDGDPVWVCGLGVESQQRRKTRIPGRERKCQQRVNNVSYMSVKPTVRDCAKTFRYFAAAIRLIAGGNATVHALPHDPTL
jgi:hypothetical protein